STEKVIIKNDLQLVLKDYGKYKRLGSPEIKKWVENALKKIIREELFDKTYLYILLEFSSSEEKIKKLMQESVGEIGFDLQHLVTKPNMKENEFLELKLY